MTNCVTCVTTNILGCQTFGLREPDLNNKDNDIKSHENDEHELAVADMIKILLNFAENESFEEIQMPNHCGWICQPKLQELPRLCSKSCVASSAVPSSNEFNFNKWATR
uniref:Uncharacterized protein n=1 Tax=Rhizophagus irregularis (strain DAOM 181602 / DAOM 197198 / MUCL 43194) TaxID=747089 RepID=U9SKZ9_RHIID